MSRESLIRLFSLLFCWISSITVSAAAIDSSGFIRHFVDGTYRGRLNRTLRPPGQGFHVEALTTVSLESPFLSSSSRLNCSLLLAETLPSGLYVDAFELRHRIEFGGPRIVLPAPIDVEAPEHRSSTRRLLAYLPFSLDPRLDALIARASLPVHVRYHAPVSGGAPRDFIFHAPEVFVGCYDGEGRFVDPSRSSGAKKWPCQPPNESSRCRWTPFDAEPTTPPIKIRAPRGDSDHVIGVVIVTLATCAWGVSLILFVDDNNLAGKREKRE